MTDLLHIEEASKDLVESTANPTTSDLMGLRKAIQHFKDLQDIFTTSPKEMWFDLLCEKSGANPEAVRYLIDEYEQLGSNGVNVIDPETGKTLVVLTEEHFYKPRKGDALAIRPEVLSSLYMFAFDRDREVHILNTLSQKALTLGVSQKEVDIGSSKGRAQILLDIPRDKSKVFENVSSTARVFLNLFSDNGPRDLRLTVETTLRRGIQDLLTTNLKFSTRSHLKAVLGNSLVKTLAKELVNSLDVMLDLPTTPTPEPIFWVAPPTEIVAIQSISNEPILVVEGVQKIMAVLKPLGSLRVEDYQLTQGSAFDRWEVRTQLVATLGLIPDSIVTFRLTSTETTTVLL